MRSLLLLRGGNGMLFDPSPMTTSLVAEGRRRVRGGGGLSPRRRSGNKLALAAEMARRLREAGGLEGGSGGKSSPEESREERVS